MRTSKRQLLIETAIEIVESEGVPGLTYDSLATASGVSKSGLIYHFPSRQDMLGAIHEHMAMLWQQRLEAIAGGPVDGLSTKARLRALIIAQTASASRAELLLTLDAVEHPEHNQIWADMMEPWFARPDQASDDVMVLQLIADGLWVYNHINHHELDDQARQRLSEHALSMVDRLL